MLDEQNKTKEIKRNLWIKSEVKKWRNKSWLEFTFLSIIFILALGYILYISNWDIKIASDYLKELNSNLIVSGFISLIFFIVSAVSLNALINKYRNHGNIQNYIKGLEIPDELKEIKIKTKD